MPPERRRGGKIHTRRWKRADNCGFQQRVSPNIRNRSGAEHSRYLQRPGLWQIFTSRCLRYQNTSGTGLGLRITKLVVEEFGGKIGFHSEEGHGATFYDDLNVCKSETPEIDTPQIEAIASWNCHSWRAVFSEFWQWNLIFHTKITHILPYFNPVVGQYTSQGDPYLSRGV